MKDFLKRIYKSSLQFLGKGLRFIVGGTWRVFWFLFRYTSFAIGAVIVLLMLIGFGSYWFFGDRIAEHALDTRSKFSFAVGHGIEGDMWQDWSGNGRDKRGKVSISEGGYLRINLSNLSDSWFSTPSLFSYFGGSQGRISRITMIEALRRATNDDKITALAVSMDSASIARLGVSGVEDFRRAVADFRAQGKPAWIFATNLGGIGGRAGLKSYYLASVFDSISLAPSGSLGLGGVRIEVPYFRGALDKLQVVPQFEAREEYKNAPQQFLNEAMSAEVTENLQGVADNVSRRWSKEVGDARRLDNEIVASLLNSPYISSSDALLRGLVDRSAYADEFWAAFQRDVANKDKSAGKSDGKGKDKDKGKGKARGISLSAYAAHYRLGQFFTPAKDEHRREARKNKMMEEENKEQEEEQEQAVSSGDDAEQEPDEQEVAEESVEEEEKSEEKEEMMAEIPRAQADSDSMPRVALLNFRGEIRQSQPDDKWGGSGGGYTISARYVTQLLRRLARDDRFHGVMLHIDSPGGDYIASDIIYHEIKRLRERKPVVVVMGDTAASGGYYIAMAGEQVFAQPFTITGSIGVFAGKISTRDFWQRWGVEWGVVQSGSDSTMHSILDPYTDSDLATLSSAMDLIYADFTGKVADSRKLDRPRVEQLAGGRIWLGEQAVANGLADDLGGYAAARLWMADRLQRPAEQILFLPYPRDGSFAHRISRMLRQAFFSQSQKGEASASMLGGLLPLLPQPLRAQALNEVAPLVLRSGVLSAPQILLMP